MSRSLESLERKVSRESPSEQVGQESSKHVEEDESREDGSEGQDSVGFGNLELSFELVESGTARREGGRSEKTVVGRRGCQQIVLLVRYLNLRRLTTWKADDVVKDRVKKKTQG